MQSKVKLSKRQLKEDKFTTFMLTAKSRLEENWQMYVVGLVALVVIIVGISYYSDWQSGQSEEAALVYAQAMSDYLSGEPQVAAVGFSQLISEYSGSANASQAAFMLARIHLEAKQYDSAVASFQTYLRKYPKNQLNNAAAHAGIAECLMAQGDMAGAADAFVKAADAFKDGPLEPDYRLSAMSNFLKVGDVDAAQAQLTLLEDNYSGTDQTNRATVLFYEKTYHQ